MTRPQEPRVHAHYHAVQFYGSDENLFTTVSGFLSEGLIAGEPAIIIATPEHTASILDRLGERLIDVDSAKRIGDLVTLDAEETLSLFMVSDSPDPALFRRYVGYTIEQSLNGRVRTPVRAYGEMVDLLWKQGRADAAIRVEILWNELATTHAFSLLCGYSMGNFYKQAKRFQDVCAEHTHTIGPDENVVPFERRKMARQA